MITVASVTMLFSGVGAGAVADRMPARLARLEWAGGFLVLVGLLALGIAVATASR